MGSYSIRLNAYSIINVKRAIAYYIIHLCSLHLSLCYPQVHIYKMLNYQLSSLSQQWKVGNWWLSVPIEKNPYRASLSMMCIFYRLVLAHIGCSSLPQEMTSGCWRTQCCSLWCSVSETLMCVICSPENERNSLEVENRKLHTELQKLKLSR